MPLIHVHSVREAVAHLKAGDLVIYPTETAYALGADAGNRRAVRQVFAMKQRSLKKTLPLIAASFEMAKRYGKFTPLARRLARQHWPGPLTLVLPAVRSQRLTRGTISPRQTIALRVSAHPTARALSSGLGRPIVSTSANPSGEKNIYSPRGLKRAFADSPVPLYVLSGGALPRRVPSTIVAVEADGLRMLRQGSVRLREPSGVA